MRRTALIALTFALVAAVPAMATAKGGGGGGGGGGTQPGPCVSISLPKPVQSFNVAGKTDLTVQLQTKIASCTGGSYVIDVVEIDGPNPATANIGSAYPGCAFASFTVGPFTLKQGDSRSVSWSTPPLPQPQCTHWLMETLRDPVTGQTWGPVVQRLDHTSRL
jgi:hypothetical protein